MLQIYSSNCRVHNKTILQSIENSREREPDGRLSDSESLKVLEYVSASSREPRNESLSFNNN